MEAEYPNAEGMVTETWKAWNWVFRKFRDRPGDGRPGKLVIAKYQERLQERYSGGEVRDRLR